MDHTKEYGLIDLYAQHAGKVSDKWKSYLDFYELVFHPFKEKPVRILEIGIQNGGSLEVWAEFFPNAECIVGCEIEQTAEKLSFNDSRISVVIGDANSTETHKKIKDISDNFDIIIDDGSHVSKDIIRSFALYFPMMSDGGLFIAEDLHCSYWDDFQGGIEAPFSSVSFFKRLADFVNREHWGADINPGRILDYFADTYGADFDIPTLDRISEVRFINSICMVRKGAEGENMIGQRIVAGTEAVVEPNINPDINGMKFVGPRTSESPFGPNSVRGEVRAAKNDELVQLLKSAHDQASDMQSIINTLRQQDFAQKSVIEKQVVELESMQKFLDARTVDLQAAQQTATNLSSALLAAQRRPFKQLNRHLTFKLLNRAQNSKFFSERTRARFSNSAKKRNPDQIDDALFVGDQSKYNERLTPREDVTHPQSSLRRLAFHRNGKPRGWFRAITMPRSKNEIRPQFRRAFFKKNGELRQDVFSFAKRNPNYYLQVNPVVELQRLLADAAPIADRDEIGRQIFERQQAELDGKSAVKLISELPQKPLISIILPVYKTPEKWLHRAIKSVQDQYYENWELCIVDDCSPTNEQRVLIESYAAIDSRIRFDVMDNNSGISGASNRALDMAEGEFCALLDHDDELTPDALLWMVEALNSDEDTDFLYSDECKVDDKTGLRFFDFIFKPSWSPEIMFNSMLTGHFTMYRSTLIRKVGGFRSEFDFSQDYDLALRMSEVARKIVHVDRVLYLWRAISGSAASGGKDYARTSNVAALKAALERRGIQGDVEPLAHANQVRVAIPEEGSRVSIVIPSDSASNLRLALDALKKGTDYENYEICVVCNSKVASTLEEEYKLWPVARFIRYDKPYNFSDKCNEGARNAQGEIVVFYNDDVFPISRDWIERLIEYFWVPGVGGVSPQLLYENGTIQYAGMISGTPGMAGTACHNLPHDSNAMFPAYNRLVRNVSVLSGACFAIRRTLFLEVGGFDPKNTPDGHSDLDLSYKIQEKGLRCVYTPYSLLTHVGNHSWGAKSTKYKADIFCLKRWGKYVSSDPYFTDTMKNALYPDFLFDFRIHANHTEPSVKYSGKDVLFVSHELTNTGAPYMLLQAARAVKVAGGFPVVVAPTDGPLRTAFEKEGIVVIIDASIAANHFLFENFAKNFDLAVVNTVVMRPVVEQLSQIPILQTVWWLHESQLLEEALADMSVSFGERVTIVCVSEYAQTFLPKGTSSQVLYNGLPDALGEHEKHATKAGSEKLVFLLLGTIEPRKGQDVFLRAIEKLNPEIRKNCRFEIAGKLSPGNEEFWASISSMMKEHPEVSYLGDLSHEEALSLIARCDVLVSCSRDDSFSLVAVEAAQLVKPLILSDKVGVGAIFGSAASLSFRSQDDADLARKMIEAYENQDRLLEMGRAARKVYEAELNDTQFAKRFLETVGYIRLN